MGKYYFNSCSPIFNVDNDGNELQGIRKGIVVEVFLIYIIYLVGIIIGSIKEQYNPSKRPVKYMKKAGAEGKKVEIPKLENNDDNNNAKPGTEEATAVKPLEYTDVEDWFYPFFGYHVIAVGFALAFSPYEFSIIITYLHFVCYVVCVILAKLGKTTGDDKGIQIVYYLTAAAQLFNIMLFIAGLGNLAQSSAGKKEDYQKCMLVQMKNRAG